MTAARSASRSTRRRAWPSVDSTSSTAPNADQSGDVAPVADVHEPLRHGGTQVGQLAGEHDPSVVDDHDVLAQILDQVELMAREQHRRPRARDLREQLTHAVDRDGIEPGEGLIQDQQVRFVDQRRDQLHTLLIAVRERIEAVARALREAETREPAVDRAAHLQLRAPTEPTQVHELVAHPHPRIQAALLGHVTEPPPLRITDRRAAPTNGTPSSSSTRPNTARIAVVFPAPFGPRNPVSRPGTAVNVHASSAATGPKCLLAASNSSTASPPMPEHHSPAQRLVGHKVPVISAMLIETMSALSAVRTVTLDPRGTCTGVEPAE